MSTIPYTLKFNRMGEWARQQSLIKLRDTYVAYGVRGLVCMFLFYFVDINKIYFPKEIHVNNITLLEHIYIVFVYLCVTIF